MKALLAFLLMARIIYSEVTKPKISNQEGELVFQLPLNKNITFISYGMGTVLFEYNQTFNLKNTRKHTKFFNQWYISKNNLDIEELFEIKNAINILFKNVTKARNITNNLPFMLYRASTQIARVSRRLSQELRLIKINQCSTNRCKNNGKCYPVLQGFQCKCTNSWRGKTCEIDVNECATFLNTGLGCQNNSTCVNTIGSYRCICNKGYMGSHCTQLKADCATSLRQELCANGYCVPTNNTFGYICICEQGWKTDGTKPECNVDVNECDVMTNKCHTECINTAGSFQCGPCPTGYTGNGLICRDIDECIIDNGGCSTVPFVNCINTMGSFHCHHCPLGWNGDGKFCTIADKQTECRQNNDCHEKAFCKIISNTEICTCPTGWSGNGYGTKGCQQLLTNCTLNCKNNGTCQRINETTTRCSCPDGYDVNNHCEKIDSICEPNPCFNKGICQLKNNYFSCSCQSGFMGSLCNVVTYDAGCYIILTEDSGILNISINGQNNPYTTCKWHIKAKNPGKIIKLSLKSLNNAGSYSLFNCNIYGLKIKDGKSNINLAKFCQSPISNIETVTTPSESVKIEYRLNPTKRVEQGFLLEWISTNRICGGNYNIWKNNHSDIINSPNFPLKAQTNTTCVWHISTVNGNRIQLKFFEIVLGHSLNGMPNSCGDYIEISDSSGTSKKICRSGQHEPIKSESSDIIIKFHTDQFDNDSMFQIYYDLINGICGGYFENSSGTIDVTTDIFKPRYEPKPEFGSVFTCSYLIKQPKYYKVKLEIIDVNMQVIDDCHVHALEIYDGSTENYPLLGRFCNQFNYNLTSTGQFMLIKFVGSKIMRSWNSNLFSFNYKINCDEVYRNQTGTISSPGFPNSYLSNVDCVYDIYAPLRSSISLQFINFSLSSRNENSCNYAVDNIKIGSVWQIASNNIQEKQLYFCKQPPSEVFAEKNHLRLILHSVNNKNNAPGFIASYSYITNIFACGGIFMESPGKISSYDFESIILKATTQCEWIITAPPNIDIEIKFEKFDMKNKMECNSYIEIFENSTSQNKLIGTKHCNEMPFKPFIYQSNIVTIILHANNDYDLIESGFIATYKFVDLRLNCGGIFTAPFGYIKSPRYPGNYPSQVNCTWIIHAPLGHQIELVKTTFELEKISQDCNADYLEIRNGMGKDSPLIGRYCGTDIPNRIPSFTNHLFINFVSDNSVSNKGFYFKWEQTSTGCGGVINSFSGSIHSPHYPETLKGAAQCDWTIQTSPASLIEFHVIATTSLSIDYFCTNDKLMIYDGPNAKYNKFKFNCTNNENIILTANSSSNILTVRFLTNIDAESNFLLEYEAICIRSFIDMHHGYIDSPNFPNIYPNDLYCKWTIFNRRSHEITMIITRLDLEIQPNGFIYDRFEIYELNNNISSAVRFNEKYPIKSTADAIFILFITDASNGASGFHIEFYIKGCGEILTNTTGKLASPNYPYSINQYCLWKIEANFGNTIEFRLRAFQIGEIEPNCTRNALTILDMNQNIFTRVCNPYVVYKIFSIPNRIAYIRYETDNIRSEKYFQASYEQKKSVCGGRIFAGDIKMNSPNYPYDYQSNLYCEWQLYTTRNHHMEITFLEFDVEPSLNCVNDYLEIYEGPSKMPNNLIKRVCGNGENIEPIRTKGDQVYILFKTNNSTEKSGWKLHVKNNCGQNINGNTGVLYPNQNKEDCIWTITAPNKDDHVFLTIRSLICSCDNLNSYDCLSRGLTFYDGDSIDSPIIVQLCQSSDYLRKIISNGNSLTIAGKNSDYKLYFHLNRNACGGLLNEKKGQFSSPLYPESYPLNSECMWLISAYSGVYLELNFIFMDLMPSNNCHDDYLEIREINDSGKLLGIFCGNKLPTTLRALKQVFVKFKTSSENVGKGFAIEYNIAQHNELEETEKTTGGNITIPSVVFIKNALVPYSWRITVPKYNQILLKFHKYINGLIVYDGFDNTAPRMELSDDAPFSKYSATNFINIITDNENLLHGFNIEWQSISYIKQSFSTNDIILSLNGTEHNISSPGYPQGYSNNLDITWILKPQTLATYIELSIYIVDIELSRNCVSDKLIIESSSNLIEWNREKWLCGEKHYYDKPYHISGKPFLRVSFTTDEADVGVGFTALAKAVCGNRMTDPHGTINKNDTKVFPFNNPICEWFVEVKSGKQIEFEFLFNVKSTVCNSTYVLIYDGLNKDSVNLIPNKMCTSFDNIIRTTSNLAYIQYYGKDISWDLFYREYSECDEQIDLTESHNQTKITSPNHHNRTIKNAIDCKWTIIVPTGKTVEIKILDGFNALNSSYEYVELKDGGSHLAKTIGKYTHLEAFTRLQSTGNILLINYVADTKEPLSSVNAIAYISTCGGTFMNPRGIITSENYPTPGGYNIEHKFCEYHIKMSKSYGLKINFDDLDLPFNNNLSQNDYIKILNVGTSFDQLTEIRTITGNDTDITSLDFTTNEIIIRFQSFKQNNKYRGFKISYKRVLDLQCNQEMSSESGQLVYQNDNQSQKGFMNCYWKITVPKGNTISAEILEFENNNLNENLNKTAVIKISNDPYIKSIILKCELKMCDRSKFNNIHSTDNKMFIQFSNKVQKLRRLKIQFDAIDMSWCPKIDGNKGLMKFSTLLLMKPFYCEVETPNLNYSQTFALYLNTMQATYNLSERFYPKISFLEIYIGDFIKSDLQAMLFKSYLYKMKTNTNNEIIALPFKRAVLKFLKTDGFQISKIDLDYKIHQCGGRKYLDKSFLTNPILKLTEELTDFPSNYGQLDCSWFITLNKNIIINLQFFYKFNLNCDNEYLKISEYESDMERSFQEIKLCSLNQTQNNSNDLNNYNITIKNNFVYIHYHITDYNPNSKLYMNATENLNGCGGNLKSNSIFYFTSEKYQNNLNCIWNYRTKLKEFFVQIEFKYNFFIEASENCDKDFLQIRYKQNSVWFDSQKYCNRTVPFILNQTSVNEIEIIFHSDQDKTADGFNIKLTDHCNLNLTIGNDFNEDFMSMITVPQTYGLEKIKCNYNITAALPSDIIELVIMHRYNQNVELKNQINQENSLNENYDELEDNINTNKNSINCRKSMIKVYNKIHNDLNEMVTICKFNYYEDNIEIYGHDAFRGENFYMVSYESELEHPLAITILYFIDRCSVTITRSEKFISNPTNIGLFKVNETSNYLKKNNCMWNMTAPSDKDILIKFKYFDFKGLHTGCDEDYLIVYNDNQNMSKSNQIVMMCGNLTTEKTVIKIPNNTSLIYMKSSPMLSSSNKFGATIYFVNKCDHTYDITELNRVLIVGIYKNNKTAQYECNYLFRTNISKYRLKLNLENFDIPKCPLQFVPILNSNTTELNSKGSFRIEDSKSCNCSYIQIFDSNSIYRNKIGDKYCNSELPPKQMQTIGTNLLIRLVSSNFFANINITLNVKAVLSDCGEQTIIIEQDYILKSPNYGNGTYPSNIKCKWYIYANSSYVVQFEKFDLEDISVTNSISTCNDYLKISYPNPSKLQGYHKYCGKQKPNDIRFPSRAFTGEKTLIEIEFSSNSFIGKSGFILNIKRDSYCNTTFSTLTGHLQMLRIDGDCKFYFNVPKHYTLSFYIKEYAFKFVWHKQITQIFKFYDGESMTLLKQIKYNMYNNYAIFLKTNKIIIELQNEDKKAPIYFDMYYIASNHGVGCGGKLTDAQGYFTSPTYPKNNRNHTICRWDIELTVENPIRIKFKEFDIGPKNLCEYNNVIIKETVDGNEEITNRYCGEDNPAEYISKGNKVAIEYKRMADFYGNGWYLEYRSDFIAEQNTNHIIV